MRALLLLAIVTAAAWAEQPNVQQIITRSVQTIEDDWNQSPNYSFHEHDVTSKRGSAEKAKSYEVLMIDGSPYNRLLAENGQQLSPAEQAQQEQLLRAEIDRRQHESPRERARRIAKYQKERDQDHEMLKNMVAAFDFHLTGEETVDGHDCWVLDATPNRNYRPTSRETKVLTGMRGKLWVDRATYQWVKVEAEVIRPVSIFGLVARVGPGTRFLLEQSPVSGNLWLPSHFSMKVNASAFGFFNENSTDDERYEHYTPAGKTTAQSASSRRATQ